MGVKNLWKILDKVKENVVLSEMQGKTLAVDLSCWICQFGSVKANHLKNTFHRICHLYACGISLVIVTERNYCPLKAWKYTNDSGRQLFQSKLQECSDLITSLGILCVQASGEAEAYCALLNSQGIVDGVLTDDNDAFLYGATMVYSNLTANEKEVSMKLCSMKQIQASLGFSRRDLVALSLILGCDYFPGGVPGVGKKLALLLIRAWNRRKRSNDFLDRLKYWSSADEDQLISNVEKYIKSKAMLIKDGFPNYEVINEYLISKDVVPKDIIQSIQWKLPNLYKFQEFCLINLSWKKSFCLEKCGVLLSQWFLRYLTKSPLYDYCKSCVLKIPNDSEKIQVKWTVNSKLFADYEDDNTSQSEFLLFTTWVNKQLYQSVFGLAEVTISGEKGSYGVKRKHDQDSDEDEDYYFLSLRKARNEKLRL